MSTFIIRNKSTLEQFVADSGKRAWSKPAHAKNAFKGSSRNIPENILVPHKDYRGNFHYDWLETPRFDDQDVFEIVELYSDVEKRSTNIERALREVSDKLANLKSALARCESLDLEDYDYLYGEVEEMQHIAMNGLDNE